MEDPENGPDLALAQVLALDPNLFLLTQAKSVLF
jgi:hypothetical protein